MANTHSLDLELSSSQCAYHADAAAFDLTGDLTFEMWLKLESSVSRTQMRLISKSATSPNRGYFFTYRDNGGTPVMTFYKSTNGTDEELKDVAYTLVIGVWTHVAMTYNNTTKVYKLYINGVQWGTDQTFTNAGIANTANDFVIGAANSSAVVPFDGLIDEVRIWNDVRTQTEIVDNMFKELVGDEANLNAYYKFNNNYSDSTANGNTLTAVNTPVFSTSVMFVETSEFLRPNAAGDETNMNYQNPGTGFHYDKVDEAIADEATTSVACNTDNTSQRDLYALPDSAIGTGTINQIIVAIRAEGNTAWSKSAIKEGGTVTESGQLTSPADDVWETHFINYATNPRTGVAWTWTNINDLQVGCVNYRQPAQLGAITQVYVIVDYTSSTDLAINLYDSINTSESVTTTELSFINVSDSLNISGSNTTTLSSSQISVFDSLTVANPVTMATNALSISVVQSLTIANTVTMAMAGSLGINVNSPINISENVTKTVSLGLSVFSLITVADTPTLNLLITAFIYDNVSIQETTNSSTNLSPVSVIDNIAAAEEIVTNGQLGDMYIFDGISITDDVQTEQVLDIAISDEIVLISDNFVQLVIDDIVLSIFDLITISESKGLESFKFSPSPGNSQPKGSLTTMSPVASAGRGSYDRPVGNMGQNRYPVGNKGSSL